VVSGFAALAMLPGLLLVAVLMPIGLGWPLVPHAAQALVWWAERERRRVGRFTGASLDVRHPDLTGSPVEQLRTLLDDRAARRELGWLAVHAVTGPVLGLVSVALLLAAVNAALVPAYWWLLPADSPINAPHGVTSWAAALPMPAVAAAYALLGLLLVPRLARWQSRWAQSLLAPDPSARLSARVSELTASRAAALEAHGAELRRIERDLHDGTQNRLVGAVMHLGIAERALRRDPDSALPLVLRAQDAANQAIAELRSVVRGIYPPVLAERGLDGALSALAAQCAIPTTLRVSGLERAPAAVESAAYFAAAEALTNVSKHSGAERAEIAVATRAGPTGDPVLVVDVTDDGHGGAADHPGGGLAGIRRRVAAFDGRVELTSPTGGPTRLRVELPCGS
jgi:signal transduction histidine kinase